MPATPTWTTLGTDDSAPFAVYHDVSSLPKGSLVEYRLVAKDLRGRYAVATTSGVVGTKGTDAEGPGTGAGPVTQPANASIPGSHNSEMGCPGDWQPECAQAQLKRDANDDIWKTTVPVAGRHYAYKIAINKSWDENYGAGGALKRPRHLVQRARPASRPSSTTTAPRTSRTPPRAIWWPRPAASSPSRVA